MAELTREFLISKYWQENKSLAEIAKELSLPSQSGVACAMRKFNIPRRTLLEAAALKPPPNLKRPNLQVSKELAYILGAHLGDGWTSIVSHKYQYTWRLKGERQFVDKIAYALQAIGLHSWIRKDNGCLRLETASKIFVEWLGKLALPDIERLLISDELKIAFVQGIYDAEGNLGVCKRKGRSFPHITVRIGNTDLLLLQLCQRLLRSLGIYSSICLSSKAKTPRQAYYFLVVPSCYWSVLFLQKIESCISHKNIQTLKANLPQYPKPHIRPSKRTLEAYRSM